MIQGIGLDIVELERIRSIYERTSSFERRILTPKERERFNQLSETRKIEYLAGRFAAKEAFAKALGTGIGTSCSFQQLDILNDATGKPYVQFHGERTNHFISITHTKTVAAAQVVLIQDER